MFSPRPLSGVPCHLLDRDRGPCSSCGPCSSRGPCSSCAWASSPSSLPTCRSTSPPPRCQMLSRADWIRRLIKIHPLAFDFVTIQLVICSLPSNSRRFFLQNAVSQWPIYGSLDLNQLRQYLLKLASKNPSNFLSTQTCLLFNSGQRCATFLFIQTRKLIRPFLATSQYPACLLQSTGFARPRQGPGRRGRQSRC